MAAISGGCRWQAARRVDGVVAVDPRVDDPRLDLLTADDALPAVVVGDPTLSAGLTSVWTDDAAAIRACVRYLADLGHRRVARVSGVEDFGHTLIRDEAFRDETRIAGVAGCVLRTDYTPDQGAAATRELLAGTDQVTAIIYDNDVMALAGLGVAHELGVRVPADVSLVAWDDSPLCQAAFPQLTALSHDVISYGAHVARRLFDRMAGAEIGAFLDSTPTLRVRGTTGPPSSMTAA